MGILAEAQAMEASEKASQAAQYAAVQADFMKALQSTPMPLARPQAMVRAPPTRHAACHPG